MKLFDFKLFSRSDAILTVDSDILFFAAPHELFAHLDAAEGRPAHNVFHADMQYAYAIPLEDASCLLGMPVVPRINCGFGIIFVDSISFEKIESYLRRDDRILRHSWAVQTLYALLSSDYGVQLLSEAYRVGLGGSLRSLVLRHYCGPLREHFFTEGLPYVRKLIADAGLLPHTQGWSVTGSVT